MTYRTPEELEAYNEGYRTAAVFIGRETTKGAEPEPKPKPKTQDEINAEGWRRWWFGEFKLNMEGFQRVFGKKVLRPLLDRVGALEKRTTSTDELLADLERRLAELEARKP